MTDESEDYADRDLPPPALGMTPIRLATWMAVGTLVAFTCGGCRWMAYLLGQFRLGPDN